MAANTSPIFGLTPVIGIATVTTGVTTRATGTNLGTALISGATAGTRIEEIVVKAETDLADSVVLIYLNNGSTSYLFDEFDCGDPAAGSTTVTSFRDYHRYENLVLPSGYSLRCTITVTPTTGAVTVYAFGADY